MVITYSKLTAQGETSVPDEVRQKLGVGPDSVLEWEEDGERIIVRRAARYTSEDLHRALFEEPPEPRTLEELDAGVEQAIRDRHARR
jgi:bifunctional DNA-binding transcriptional regulator/antitoxin component of YhaV-PrlF toxin-antitoxin module